MESALHTAHLVGSVVGLLLIAAGTLAVTKRLRFPFTVGLVLVGVLLSQLAAHGMDFIKPLTEYEISPGVILFVFLPTLIFESAFNLDARQLRHNILPVLTLAVPGLLLSTAIIGIMVWAMTPFDLAVSLLLGAILSATDPVAVIALFKQLGVPKQLTVLMEGESLFNDASSIVVAQILVGVVTAGYFATQMVFSGLVNFVVVFLGGVFVGWLLAVTTGWILGRVEGDPFIEISLTTVLAYFSFLVAEEAFHVSGVMATVAAGVVMGGWGRAKITPSVAGYLEHFWEYLAFVANALIFLLVGLRVELGALYASLGMLALVIVAMLVSRALVVFTLVPLTSWLFRSDPIDRRYQVVMYWGGLRGAIALAIVLSLKEVPQSEILVALVMGAVLFTLLVNGLSIEWLVRQLGLDKPPLADRLARVEGLLSAKHHALEEVPVLQRGGLFSARIAGGLQQRLRQEAASLRDNLTDLRKRELEPVSERILLFNRCFAAEKSYYYHLFGQGHLSEQAYRDLCHSIDLQNESIRQGHDFPAFTLHPPEMGGKKGMREKVEKLLGFVGLAEHFSAGRVARDYEEAWGRYQGCTFLLGKLDELARVNAARPEVAEETRLHYRHWHTAARERIDLTAAQFPEFVNAMQEHLAGRLVAHTQTEVIEGEVRAGTIPTGVAEKIAHELADEVRRLRSDDIVSLRLPPDELLRKVPFFRDTPVDEFARVVKLLNPRTIPAGEAIIRQGERGESLLIISRGVVRVSRQDDGQERDLATLMAGDFFGEMALLHHEPRTATCRAVTPCALYELKSVDFVAVKTACPAIQAALEEADRKHAAALTGKSAA